MASYLQLANDTEDGGEGDIYPFKYIGGSTDMDVNDEFVDIADLESGVTEIEATGINRKSLSISVSLTSETSGDTAVFQSFEMIEWIRSNLAELFYIHLEFDAGATIRNYVGKLTSKISSAIDQDSPNEVILSFLFIIQGVSWDGIPE